MAGDEAADGSWNRRQMDLNIYLGLPPLPRPPRLLSALDCPVSSPNSIRTAPVAPITDEPVELLTPVAVAYSPSNALSTPEEESMLDPYVYAWLDGHSTDGEEGTDAAEPDVVLGVTVDDASVPSSPSRVPAGLEGDDDLTLRMESFVHPGGVTDSLEMVSTVNLQNQGAVDLESTTPELRLLNLIRISQQHSIVRTGSANLHQQARSPEADRLSWAIKRSHDSLEVARRQKLDGDNKVREEGSVNKDDCCGCNSSFECNICLDEAKEPVVTPCGHLFCWPCLYTWLHVHSVHSECPVCKGEVLEVNVTPIYGRADDQRDASVLDMPPRPHANRKQSLGQQLQTADARRATTVVRQLIENMATATWRRPRAPSRRRQDTVSTIMLNTNSNQITLPPSGADNTASEVSAAPQQSSSVEQSSISSTAAVIVGEPVSSRRSRPSVSVDTRRIRRRQE